MAWSKDNKEERRELFELRKQIAINSQIGEFVSEVHDIEEASNVFDALLNHLCQLTFFNKIVFLTLSIDTAELKVLFSRGFKHEDNPNFAFNIFEIQDNEILSAIFERQTQIVASGFGSSNDLSLRLDMDNYIIIPLVYNTYKTNAEKHENNEDAENVNEEVISDEFYKEKQKLKDPYFPVSGIFVFGGDNLSEFDINESIPIAEKLIHIAGITMTGILALENLRKMNEKHEEELKRAQLIQEKFLPEKLPNDYHLQCSALYKPVEDIGGDYYDFFALRDGVYALFIADVAGHGVSAALVMSTAQSLLKTTASADLGPAQTLRKINDTLKNHIKAERYLTAFYAIIDTTQNKMTYTCAGHCPTLLFNKKSGEYQQFQSVGFPVGLFPELDLPNHEYYYKKDENRLVLYTDGVTDCQNREGAKFELIRLNSIVAKTLDCSPENVVATITKELESFRGSAEMKDDQTLLIVDF